MAFQRRKSAAVGIKAPFPGFVEPELATAIEKVPSGERWLHEIKFDGYRVQVHRANEAVKVFTRRGNDWTKRFRKIADDAWHISAGSAIIDGEVVVPGENGTTDFSVLQNALKGKSKKIVLVAFDLLYLNGYDGMLNSQQMQHWEFKHKAGDRSCEKVRPRRSRSEALPGRRGTSARRP